MKIIHIETAFVIHSRVIKQCRTRSRKRSANETASSPEQTVLCTTSSSFVNNLKAFWVILNELFVIIIWPTKFIVFVFWNKKNNNFNGVLELEIIYYLLLIVWEHFMIDNSTEFIDQHVIPFLYQNNFCTSF